MFIALYLLLFLRAWMYTGIIMLIIITLIYLSCPCSVWLSCSIVVVRCIRYILVLSGRILCYLSLLVGIEHYSQALVYNIYVLFTASFEEVQATSYVTIHNNNNRIHIISHFPFWLACQSLLLVLSLLALRRCCAAWLPIYHSPHLQCCIQRDCITQSRS